MREVLIVDGYNIIGDWPVLRGLKAQSLEAARDLLLDDLKEYKAITGREVIVVFDAHLARGGQTEETVGGVRLLYTKELETADELIERLVYEYERQKVRRHVYVATSDYVEQQVTFGGGALRISARELRIYMRDAKKEIEERMKGLTPGSNRLGNHLSPEVREMFEKWRRK
ncbi:NYN domain-containing protein [Tumebacillus sp. ITR2]|uniref:NYN domain-containing protein n=1 Tax=Tumebacillus amylolyticus TaxID=2801339 RepID=A0ABS1JGK7_9BACL|nr:NYN domain-containing protein [Tumebacillus amylolyticus]MBL0389425.1 NYN domain-containing protein [Tumebacillus amylolyticus]